MALMTIALIILAILAYAGSILAFGRGPKYLNPNILGAIINAIGVAVPLTLYAFGQRALGANPAKGFMWALFGGICIGVFTVALARLFATGQNLSFVPPLVYGGAILIAALAGLIIFKEKVSLIAAIGLLLIVAGIILLALSSAKGEAGT